MKKFIVMCSMLCVGAMAWSMPGVASAKRYKIKLATLVPKGSAWMNVFDQLKWEIKKKSKGRLRLKMYAGGRMGDEKAVVGKMQMGTLDGAALTSIGLGQINKEILALQLPFLFKKYKELDYVRTKLKKNFRDMLLKKGFVLMGWGDLGYIYIFSKKKIKTVADMRKAKIWAWTDDPITQQFAKMAGFTPRLLSLLQVRNGLQTGIIDTIVATPLTLIAMQWHSYVKYRVKYKFAIGLGATVMRKKSFDKLPADLQKLLLDTSMKHHDRLVKIVRRDNRRARYTLKKRGMKGLKMTKDQRKLVRKLGRQVQKHFIGKLYNGGILKKIKAAVKEYRSK